MNRLQILVLSCLFGGAFALAPDWVRFSRPQPTSPEEIQGPPSLMASQGEFARKIQRPLITGLRLSNRAALPDVLERLQPSEEDGLAGWLHAVHLFGADTTISLGGEQAGILDLIFDGERLERHLGSRVLAQTRHGLRFPLVDEWMLAKRQSNTESHPGQGLAALATSAVPLSQPVRSGGRTSSVVEILHDVEASFVLEGEIYWDAVALAIYLPPRRTWSNKFGKNFSFDDVVEALIKRAPSDSSCAGTHGLISLTTILRADGECEILSAETRRRLRAHLSDVVSKLRRTRLPDGGWGLDWDMAPSSDPGAVRPPVPPFDVILATGHHLEWLLLLPEDLQLERSICEEAAEQTLRLLRLHADDRDWIVRNYCPAVHAARSVRLLVQDESEP